MKIPWTDWSVKNHIDEAERLSKRRGAVQEITEALALAQIHATLALTKAELGQVTVGY